METKNVLKTAGKVALTVASPPLGALFLKEDDPITPGLIGLFVSIMATAAIKDYSISRIYDSPTAYTTLAPNNSPRGVLESLACPIAYALDRSKVTILEHDKVGAWRWSFEGDNIIQYDKDTGKYVVNFNEQVGFGPISSSMNELSSLEDVSRDSAISSLKASLEGLTSNGDLIKAKDLAKQYDDALVKHQEKLEEKSEAYSTARKVLDEVVIKMNAELDSQRAKLAGNAK